MGYGDLRTLPTVADDTPTMNPIRSRLRPEERRPLSLATSSVGFFFYFRHRGVQIKYRIRRDLEGPIGANAFASRFG